MAPGLGTVGHGQTDSHGTDTMTYPPGRAGGEHDGPACWPGSRASGPASAVLAVTLPSVRIKLRRLKMRCRAADAAGARGDVHAFAFALCHRQANKLINK